MYKIITVKRQMPDAFFSIYSDIKFFSGNKRLSFEMLKCAIVLLLK